MRLSWNGVHCHQLCDPTDIGHEEQMRTLKGRNTGVVRAAVEVFWNDMKRAHFIDAHTRVMTITMQLNSNHIGIRYRVTLMFELTSLGSILPSYEASTRLPGSEVYRSFESSSERDLILACTAMLISSAAAEID